MKKLLILLVFITNLYSLEFDNFKLGESLTDVVNYAIKNDIPLTTQPASSGKFDKTILKKLNKITKLNYPTKLLGANGWVHLYFSPKSKKLYKIDISVHVSNLLTLSSNINRKEFNLRVVELLTKKYGMPKKTFDSFQDIIDSVVFKGKKLYWKINNTEYIFFTTKMGSTRLLYINKNLVKLAKKEKSIINKHLTKKVISQEFNRF